MSLSMGYGSSRLVRWLPNGLRPLLVGRQTGGFWEEWQWQVRSWLAGRSEGVWCTMVLRRWFLGGAAWMRTNEELS